MFLSIIRKFEEYDKYGEHRLNGFKGVYFLMLLFLVNFLYKIPNPYFNYFYVSLTAMTISVTGETIQEKALLFFFTVMGAILIIFIFSLIDIYPTLFIISVFAISMSFYFLAIHYFKGHTTPIPVILSLGVYSLIYGHINTNIFVAINNAMITMLAMLIILAGLVFFPKSYNFRVWLRAYILLLKQILHNLNLVKNNENREIQVVQGNLVQLVKYSNMLPRKLPIFTILKINFLVNELRVLSCTIDQKIISLPKTQLEQLIRALELYVQAVEKEKPFSLKDNNLNDKNFLTMVSSWNYLCSKI